MSDARGWDSQWPDELVARLIELWHLKTQVVVGVKDGHPIHVTMPLLSTKEIGIRLGFGPDGKNRVIGKAHRLKLERRPSPIRPLPENGAERRLLMLRNMFGAGRTDEFIAAQLGTCQSWVQRKRMELDLRHSERGRPKRSGPSLTLAPLKSLEQIIAAVKVPAPKREPAPRPAANFGKCCMVLGDPGRSSWRYCDEPITTRGPYCDDHRAIAYRKTIDRRTLQEVA